MNKIIIIGIAIALVVVGISGWYYFEESQHLMEITNVAEIPNYKDESTLAIAYGYAGILTCAGKIIGLESSPDRIELLWKADVVFPTNYVSGVICKNFGNVGFDWAKCNQPRFSDNHADVVWKDAKEESHILEIKEMYYPEYVAYEYYVDGNRVRAVNWVDSGYSSISDGVYSIRADFSSKLLFSDAYTLDISTDEFFFIVEDGNYFFSKNKPFFNGEDDLEG